MPQGTLFGPDVRGFIINVDGASRGNPGPAAAGWVIRDADGQILIEEGLHIGDDTNNRAEYLALIFALEDALMLRGEAVVVRSDSELLVKQINGEYRVKNAGLKGFFARVKRLGGGFKSFHVEHVRREENREADRAANEALDEAKKSAAKRPPVAQSDYGQ